MVVLIATVTSPFYFVSIALGQTSVLCLALILAAFLPDRKFNIYLQTGLLCLLTIKPYYFMVVLPIVLICSGIRPIIYTALITLLGWVVLTFKLTSGWIYSYFEGLSFYSTNSFPAYYSYWLKGAGQMHSSIFQFQSYLSGVYLFSSLLALSLAVRVMLKISQGRLSNLQIGFPVVLSMFAMTIFTPQHGIYENILIIVPFLFSFRYLNVKYRAILEVVLLGFFLLGFVNTDREVLWVAKLSLFILLAITLYLSSRGEKEFRLS